MPLLVRFTQIHLNKAQSANNKFDCIECVYNSELSILSPYFLCINGDLFCNGFVNFVLCEDKNILKFSSGSELLFKMQAWLCCFLPQNDVPVMKVTAIQFNLIFSHCCVICPVKSVWLQND